MFSALLNRFYPHQHPPQMPKDERTKTISTATDRLSSPLLRLPRELRDEIYEYAIIGDVFVPRYTCVVQSPLSHVNKQIRDETLPMFYRKSTFIIDITDYDSRTLQRAHPRDGANFAWRWRACVMEMRPHWPNLLLWLKELHMRRGNGLGYLIARATPLERTAVASLFELVRSLRDLPWDRVEKILEQQRKVLVRIDARWGDDKGVASDK